MSEPSESRLKRDLFKAVKKKLILDKASRDCADEEIRVIVEILLKHSYRITDIVDEFETQYELGRLLNSGVYGMVYQCIPLDMESADESSADKMTIIDEEKKKEIRHRPLVCKIMNKSEMFNLASEGQISLPELLLRIRNVRSEISVLKGVCMKEVISMNKIKEEESLDKKKKSRKDNRGRRRLCRVYGVFESDTEIKIVMEEMIGGELFAKLRRVSRLDEFEAADVTKQICQALQYLHKTCKVMHCDLKPANIMFADIDERKVKLIDFGFAKRFEQKNESSEEEEYSCVPCGSPHYTAPEAINLRVARSVFEAKFKRRKRDVSSADNDDSDMVELSPHYSYPSDMWSVGCIVFTMVFGFPPFMNRSLPPGVVDKRTVSELNTEIYLKVLKGFYPEVMDVRRYGYGAWFPNNIPVSQECRDFISGLLVRNHRSRMTAEKALKHPWLLATHKLSKIPGISTMQDLKLISLVPEPPVLSSIIDINNSSDTSSSCSSSGSSTISMKSSNSLMLSDDSLIDIDDTSDLRTGMFAVDAR